MLTQVAKLLAVMAAGLVLAGCASPPTESRMAQMKDKGMGMHGCQMAMATGPGTASGGDQTAPPRRRMEKCAHMAADHDQADAVPKAPAEGQDHSKHLPQP